MIRLNPHISLLFRMGDSYFNSRLQGTGLTTGTANLLYGLANSRGMRLTELSKIAGVDNAHTSRAMVMLEKKGFVLRIPDPGDGRAFMVSLTPAGRASVHRIKKIMTEWVAIVTRGVSPHDIDEVNRILDLLYVNARNHLAGDEE